MTNQPAKFRPSVIDALQWFDYTHLPEDLQEVSKPFYDAAYDAVEMGTGPQVTLGLHHLLQAKDCFVRAALAKKQESSS